VIDFDMDGGTPIFQYSIDNGTTFSAAVNFINLAPGVYPIYVEDQNGCFNTESIEIFPSTNPNIDNFNSTLEFCSLSDGGITSTTSLGITPYQFVLYQGPALISNNPTGTFTGLQSGVYSLLVIDQIGCVDSVVVTVDSIPSPIAPLQDTILCNLTLQINGVLSYTGSNWTANSPLVNFSNPAGQNPTIVADTAGIYSITMSDSVCNFTETFQLTFVADPFTTILDTTLCIGETQVLAALVQPQNVSYIWSTGETTSAISVTETGEYIVSTTNMCGVSIDTATVNFYFCDIEVPNVFTPNNDGNNDYFQLLFFGGIKTFNCTILNRWGQVIREYDNPAFMWDGKDESGDDVLEGVYFYIAKAVSNGGNEILKHGNVTVVRSK
jgi:gliding motility-associated-like protein